MNPPPGTAWYNTTQNLPPQNQVADRPYDCSGWLGSRTYFEAQTWFTRPGEKVGPGSTQLTVGACLPHKQMIAGILPVDILLQKTNWPSMANVSISMKVAFFWKGGNVSFELTQSGNAKNWACNNNAPTCKSVYRTSIDTRPTPLIYMIPGACCCVPSCTQSSATCIERVSVLPASY